MRTMKMMMMNTTAMMTTPTGKHCHLRQALPSRIHHHRNCCRSLYTHSLYAAILHLTVCVYVLLPHFLPALVARSLLQNEVRCKR